MATTTLLNAVLVATTGSGSSITGDFEFLVRGNPAGGDVELQMADTDTAADYASCGIEAKLRGPGQCSIRNNGTKYYRAKYSGPVASLASSATVTAKIVQ